MSTQVKGNKGDYPSPMKRTLQVIGLAVLLLSIILYINKVKDYKIEELQDPHVQAVSNVEPPVEPIAPVPVPEPIPEPTPIVEPPVAPEPPKPVYYPMPEDQAKAFIYSHESGNNPAAVNSIGCRGLGQACPGSKLPCSDTDYACQDTWFTNYMLARYGSWSNAHQFWLQHSWW